MELTYLTIILAIVSLWHKKLPNLWGYLLGLALLVGVYREVVQIEGVLYTVVYIVTAILAIRRKFSINGYELSTEAKPIIHSAFIVIFVVLTLLLLHHSVPFYEPWILYSDIVLHENSPATGMSIKLDNAVVGVVIIALATTRASTLQQWKTLLYKSLPYNVGTVAILISIAVYFNFLQFSFVESNYIVPTLISFLFFTCLAEEAFFRVYVQGNLEMKWSNKRYGNVSALMVASLIFGLAHYQGGPYLVLVATLAGIGYGLCYQKTGRVEAAIIAHFCLNSFHFVFLTYPHALQ